MNIFRSGLHKLQQLLAFVWRFVWWKKLILVIVFGAVMWFARSQLVSSASQEPQYVTATAEVGTLVSTISGTGTITSGNSTSITTGATGVVSSVFVSNGDTVVKGQKIAEITLDAYAQEKRTKAWAAYLDAQEAVKTAQKNKVTADIEMWTARQAIIDAEDEIADKNAGEKNPETKEAYTLSEATVVDKSLEQAQLAFSEAELKYKNADSEIALARSQVTAAFEDYQELSPTVVAPSAGVVSNLALSAGVTIESTENDNSDTANANGLSISPQKIGQIDNKAGQFQASVSLTEIDIVGVSANQKVTLTLDAFPDMTFTGKVLAVDTSGSSNSGVTTYAVTILMDPTTANVYPKMAVSAEIITSVKSDVLLVPSAAIQTLGEVSTVQVQKDGEISMVTVEAGESNGTKTEITSGLSAGDVVVTATLSANDENSPRNSNTNSAFGGSGLGGGMRTFSTGGGGGGTVIMNAAPMGR